jgi:hypothetical protein
MTNPQPSPFDSERQHFESRLMAGSMCTELTSFNFTAIQGSMQDSKAFFFSDIADSAELRRVRQGGKPSARLLFKDIPTNLKQEYKAARLQKIERQTHSSHKRLNSSQELLATMTSASTKKSLTGSYKPSLDLSSTIRSKASAREQLTSREGELFEIRLQDFDFEKSVSDSSVRESILGPTRTFCSDCQSVVSTSVSLNLPTVSL